MPSLTGLFREKYGWLEQDHLVFEPLALGYDLQAYFDDTIRNILDAQASDVSGLIPGIAPEYGNPMGGGYRNDPNWGSAVVLLPLKIFQYYGDISVLETAHTAMVDYMDYLYTRASGKPYLLDGGLGDWETLDATTSKNVTLNFAYHQVAAAMSAIEDHLGNTNASTYYNDLSNDIKQSFHERWFNTTETPHYCSNSQACNALALDMGAVPEEYESSVLDALIASLESHDWHWTVGEIALPSLIRVLQKASKNEVLFNLFTQTTIPSYGAQVAAGATSLWEHWDAPTTGGSLNHFMFGYGDLYIQQLSGLSRGPDSISWDHIIYNPIVTGDLTSASTSYRTVLGLASAIWHLDGKTLTYDIVVPVGSQGTVTLDSTSVQENDNSLQSGRDGIVSVDTTKNTTIVTVGSGTYSFTADLG